MRLFLFMLVALVVCAVLEDAPRSYGFEPRKAWAAAKRDLENNKAKFARITARKRQYGLEDLRWFGQAVEKAKHRLLLSRKRFKHACQDLRENLAMKSICVQPSKAWDCKGKHSNLSQRVRSVMAKEAGLAKRRQMPIEMKSGEVKFVDCKAADSSGCETHHNGHMFCPVQQDGCATCPVSHPIPVCFRYRADPEKTRALDEWIHKGINKMQCVTRSQLAKRPNNVECEPGYWLHKNFDANRHALSCMATGKKTMYLQAHKKWYLIHCFVLKHVRCTQVEPKKKRRRCASSKKIWLEKVEHRQGNAHIVATYKAGNLPTKLKAYGEDKLCVGAGATG